jgi:hypothetical protein
MTTTESEKMESFEDVEDAENGMRQRASKQASMAATRLSLVSRMYDVDGDGKLDAAEQ